MSDRPDDWIGTTVGGYRLLEVLGRGGVGNVYRAEDRDGAAWAVKVLHGRGAAAEARRLRREHEVAGRLSHPNVVRIVAAGEDGGRPYLVMELVDGISLRDALARAGRVPAADALPIAAAVLRGLHAAHQAGVVHRDVKPANILLARPGPGALAVKLADFGVALVAGMTDENDGTDGRIVGTPQYMAPEQWANPEAADARSDLYALGCTLFEAVCGRPPFDGDNVERLLYQHTRAPRPRVADHGDAPRVLTDLIDRLIAIDPADRPADVPAAIADLEAAIHAGITRVTAENSQLYAPAEHTREQARPPTTYHGPPASGIAAPPDARSPRTAATGEGAPARPEATIPQPGSRLGNYEIVQTIWRDYASALYQARDTVLDADVTLDVLSPQARTDPAIVLRFLHKARAGARVSHPNVQKVYAVGETVPGDASTTYCVLEPLHGESLGERLRDGPRPVDEVFDVIGQALLGLHAVHAADLIHRDIKPRNLFLTAAPPDPRRDPTAGDRMVKLVGFHLVKVEVEEAITHVGAVMGTPTYMPPEQASGRLDQVGPRSDLYSLGCVAFEMACGRPPYVGDQVFDLIRQHVEADVPDPAEFRPDLPPGLRDVIRTLLAKDPADRYPSAAAALQALEAAWPARVAGGARPAAETAADQTPAADTAEAPGRRRPVKLVRPQDQAFSSQTVLTHYPAPIAIAFRRFYRQSEPRARLDRLFYAAEAALRYLVTLGVSDLFACLADGDGDTLDLPTHDAFDFLRRPKPMTLGMWRDAVRETARALAQQPNRAVVELPEVCAPGGAVESQVVAALLARRNQTAHAAGGVALTPDECDALCRETRPILEEFLKQIRFVCEYPLGFVQRGLNLGRHADSRPGYYLHSCMGAAVQHTAEAYHIQTDAPLREKVPFVVAGGERLVYLWPLLQYRVSPLSERHTLYAFEDIPDRNYPFLTLTRSNAIDARDEWRQPLHPGPAANHAWLLGPLREFRHAGTAPAELELHHKLMPWRGGALTGLRVDGILLQAPIGRGGFGTIYAATTPAGERVAVKVLEATSVTPRQLDRFRREFDRLQTMDPHPGIVRCFEMSAALLDGRVYPWYSMEFAPGGDLGGRADERRGGPLAPVPWKDDVLRGQVVGEFRQVVAAVAHLHDRHLIHRDIKPSNVLVMEDGSLRLSDFGLAKNLEPTERSLRLGPMTSAGAVMGTRDYMAPEQEKGQDVAEPGDVYALGVLLAELAAGERPRPNTRVGDGSTLQGWRKLKQLPEELQRFVLRLTAAQPERRPPDARAVEQEFEALTSGLV